ncbi:ERBB receptor feedback inhibitor 1 isoform X2 [Esox lucius]|nr:ERBB receptor feedback inhibitor 1 isoform X2 [Esox lucius]
MQRSLREFPQHHPVSHCIDIGTSGPHHPLDASSHNLTSRPIMPCTPEGDQVVPSFQRLSVYEQGPSRTPKPLPPLPDLGDISSDEAADSEVEFFIDERSCLLPPRCFPKAPALCYGAPRQRTVRACGQVNYALHDRSPGTSISASFVGSSSAGVMAHSMAISGASKWAGSEASGWADNGGNRGDQEQQMQFMRHPEPGSVVLAAKDITSKQPDRPQRSRLRRSHSGPTGSFKPSGIRMSCHLHHQHGSCRGYPQLDKPEVPPRIPIHRYPTKIADGQSCHVAEDQDKPPKVPPREPIVPPCGSSCTPNPKTLPVYVNGVMPPTQSFAPNPKYVSQGPQMLQQPRGGQPENLLGPRSPCIVPIMEDGRKDSATHYFLLPRRPSYMDRLERFL